MSEAAGLKGRVFHMAVDVEGVLGWTDAELRKLFMRGDGETRPGSEVRAWLQERLALGVKKLPFGGKCVGWSDATGCPGHEEVGV